MKSGTVFGQEQCHAPRKPSVPPTPTLQSLLHPLAVFPLEVSNILIILGLIQRDGAERAQAPKLQIIPKPTPANLWSTF